VADSTAVIMQGVEWSYCSLSDSSVLEFGFKLDSLVYICMYVCVYIYIYMYVCIAHVIYIQL
jgi:hypothetical protein